MKCGNPAAAEDDGGRMVDAAEALAGMARCSAASLPQHVTESVVISQDLPVAAEGQCGYAATAAATSEKVVLTHSYAVVQHGSATESPDEVEAEADRGREGGEKASSCNGE